jgi:hypothetical protein
MNNEKKNTDTLIIDVWGNLKISLDLKIENRGLEIRNASITNNPKILLQPNYDDVDDFETETVYDTYDSVIDVSKEEDPYSTIMEINLSRQMSILSAETAAQPQADTKLDFNVNII